MNFKIKECFISIIKKIKDNNYLLLKLFFVIVIFYILFYSTIIRTNENYGNDLSMQIHYTNVIDTTSFSDMLLPSLLRKFFPTYLYIYDLSPLSQIVSILFLTLSGLILINMFSNFKGIFIVKVASVLIIGLNPAFLECISSKINATYYGASIFFALLPLVFYKKKSNKFIILTILSLLFSSCLCHAASGIFLVSIIFLFLHLITKNEDIKHVINLLKKPLIAYVISLIIFVIILNIVNIFNISSQKYVFNGFLKFLYIIFSIYKEILTVDFLLIWAVISILIFLIVIIALIINSNRNKFISFIITIFSIILVFMFQFGIIPLVTLDYLHTGKYCIGYGVSLSIAMLFCVEYIKKFKLLLILPLILTWCFCIYTIKFGNLLGVQKEYNIMRLLMLVNDLDNMRIMDRNDLIYVGVVTDSKLYSPVVLKASAKYRGITKLIPMMLKDKNFLKYYYYRSDIEIVDFKEYSNYRLELYTDTYFHKIETNNKDYIKITLK